MEVLTPLGQVTCRIALIACSCDLPARALLTNIVQYNGRNGCHLCEDTGANERSKPLHRWWPFNKDMVLRSHHSLIDNARTATETHSSVGLDILLWSVTCFYMIFVFVMQVKGVKGPTVLLLHAPFDICQGFVIDVLHCIFLGITKNLLSFWFGKAHTKKPYSIRKKVM